MTYTIKRIRAYFNRAGYSVQLYNDDGSPYARQLRYAGPISLSMYEPGPATFYGNDGRKVRAEAIAFAKLFGAKVQL